MSCGLPVGDTTDLRHTFRVERTFIVIQSVKENFKVKENLKVKESVGENFKMEDRVQEIFRV